MSGNNATLVLRMIPPFIMAFFSLAFGYKVTV